MKKIFTSALLAFCSASLFAQSPIILNSTNYPAYTDQHLDLVNTNIPTFMNFVNGSWDYGTVHSGNAAVTNDFTNETDPFFTAAGIDVYITAFKNLTATLGYNFNSEYDFNGASADEKGLNILQQHYGVGSFTGNMADSIKFPAQKIILSAPRKAMVYPATYLSTWTSDSRRVVDFTLTVAAGGLNDTPGQHIFHITRTDSVIGWGKMRVYTPNGPSQYYDVLIDKSTNITVDSFFLAGSVAPAQLTNAFGVTQGQTSVLNRILCFRDGFSAPLVSFNYGNNNFTTPVSMFIDTDSLKMSSVGLEENSVNDFSTILFPNPSHNGQINIQINGNMPDLKSYSVYDLNGSMVQSGNLTKNTSFISIQLQEQIAQGTYIISFKNSNGTEVFSERVVKSE